MGNLVLSSSGKMARPCTFGAIRSCSFIKPVARATPSLTQLVALSSPASTPRRDDNAASCSIQCRRAPKCSAASSVGKPRAPKTIHLALSKGSSLFCEVIATSLSATTTFNLVAFVVKLFAIRTRSLIRNPLSSAIAGSFPELVGLTGSEIGR